ncbi:MAG: 50S ribosomal protein L1 [Chlamydiia bacterium]|nr:50S ribosomal protein L1 [Chlamydiia bacterium]
MGRNSKRNKKIAGEVDKDREYSIDEAVELLKKCPPVKFDQTVEVAIRLGLDPRKSDQQVRGTVGLPHGTGKTIRVVVLCKGDKVKEAMDAGAEEAGAEELLTRIKDGWMDFDAIIATPDMMREVGKLGKVLGPRGLMPTPKAGTVTNDVGKAVAEIKAGKIEYKLDRHAVVNNGVGKLSFEDGKLVENIRTLLNAIVRAKPPGAKGQYLRGMVVSSTMGPGLKIDLREEATA